MFNYYQPTKIHFGEGRLEELGSIAKKYGMKCFMVTTPDEPLVPLYNRVKKILNEASIDVVHFNEVEPNPSSEMIERGFALLKENPCDFILAVGGGSSIDTAKTLAFTNGQERIKWDELLNYSSPYEDYAPYSDTTLPIISVPTTSGTGSQVTQAAVVTLGKEKLTFYHPSLFSKECILDSELTLTLPNRITAATGFDAFTHAFESYINPRASLYSENDSLTAMKLVVENLPKALANPKEIEYRKNLSMADTLAGRALANSGASAPHPLSELIGGIVHMAHGEALAVVFPPFIKYSYESNKEKMDIVAKIFNPNADNLYDEISKFLKTIGCYKTLKECGVSQEDYLEMVKSPMLDHLPFGDREYLENIMREAYGQ